MRGEARIGARCGVLAAAFLAGVAALACSTGGPPVPDSGFLPGPERMTARPERFPFYRVWIKPGIPREQFKRVLIQPVSTDHLLGIDWTREQRSTRESAKIQHTVCLRVLTRDNAGAARSADGVIAENTVEAHPSMSEGINVRSRVQSCQTTAVNANRLTRMIICHDKEDIRTFFWRFAVASKER